MKKLLVLTSLFAVFAFATPAALADRGGRYHDHGRRYVDTCDHCHHPVYSYRRVAGYDHCGRPVYRWVTAPHRGCVRERIHHPRYRDGGYYRDYYGVPRHPHYYHGRQGLHFGFRFSR